MTNYIPYMEGVLEKLSTSFFVGFQRKLWTIAEDMKTISYRSELENDVTSKATFKIDECSVSQGVDESVFTLQTPERCFTLRAFDHETKTKWIKAITNCKKTLAKIRKNSSMIQPKVSIMESNPESPLKVNKRHRSPKRKLPTSAQLLSAPFSPSKIRQEKVKSEFQEFTVRLPSQFQKYHVGRFVLKTKADSLFQSLESNPYILFSPKSLQPSQHVVSNNLLEDMLPDWANLSTLYRLSLKDNQHKSLFSITSIAQIVAPEGVSQFTVKVGANFYDFSCVTVEERDETVTIIEQARTNAMEALSRDKINYDWLIRVQSESVSQFKDYVASQIQTMTPPHHKYEPEVPLTFIDNFMGYFHSVTNVISRKRANCQDFMKGLFKPFNESLKRLIKLSWDSSHGSMRTVQILRLLQSLSKYSEAVGRYISDPELIGGMAELSKIYIREAWRNFQKILMNLVNRQMRPNNDSFRYERSTSPRKNPNGPLLGSEPVYTFGVTDLFRFLYEIYDLGSPCWQHPIHLTNVSKLMLKALSQFVSELRDRIPKEQSLSTLHLMAMANNYFPFMDAAKQLYYERFSFLEPSDQELETMSSTEMAKKSRGLSQRELYDAVVDQFRQMSLQILEERLSTAFSEKMQEYCGRCGSIDSISVDTVYKLVKEANIPVAQFHSTFARRYYSKVFSCIRDSIVMVLERSMKARVAASKGVSLPTAYVQKTKQQLTSLNSELLDLLEYLCGSRELSSVGTQLSELPLLMSLSQGDMKNPLDMLSLSRKSGHIGRLMVLILGYRGLTCAWAGPEEEVPPKAASRIQIDALTLPYTPSKGYKSKLIIDYLELQHGSDEFSYVVK